MKTTTFIYGLADPRDGALRYIGKSNDPRKRLERHVRECKETTCHRHRWLSSLLAGGVKPQIIIIEECNRSDWEERERFWIDHYRRAGNDLVNTSEGGDGNKGYKFSAESRQRMSEARKGKPFSEEHKQKISESLKGRVPSEACRAAALDFHSGAKRSPETLAKMAASHTGLKKSAETIEKYKASRQLEYIVTSPEGIEFRIKGFGAFCREHGLSTGNLGAVLRGTTKHCKGWKIRRPE